MTALLESLHAFLRGTHVVVGFLGLCLFWCIMFVRKGTRLHRFLGKSFVAAAFYVGVTAIASSLWALLHVDSFAPYIVTLSAEAQAAKRGQHQFLFLVLLFFAMVTVTGALYGLHSIRLREDVAALRRTSLLYWQGASALSGLILAAFGLTHLFAGAETSGMPREAYWIPLVLGGLGFLELVKEMRQVCRPLPEPKAWLYRHVEQMLGTGVAFHTAFLVFGARVWLAPYLKGPLYFLPWVAPLVIGGFAIKWYVSRLKAGHSSVPAD